jgi:glycosyltransferase involved in cell wall biosynthesis
MDRNRKYKSKYVIITPVYNESRFIRETIKAVASQTIVPEKWIIVDDGSTDDTAEIVKQYVNNHHFIEFYSNKRRPEHTYYESNVYAILEGYEKVKGLDFEYLAILDADIILCNDYYEEIFRRFDANMDLGIATGTYLEGVDGCLKEALIDRRSTPKALQVFRRVCFEEIGGYIPCKNGGEDSCAEILARMYGWQTWSFPDIKVIHQRSVGTRDGRTVLYARFKQGLTDYCLCTHPIFMLAKCLRRCLIEKPFINSGVVRLAGFLYGYIVREQRQIPYDAKRFVHKEQMRRLLACVGIGPKLWEPVQLEK